MRWRQEAQSRASILGYRPQYAKGLSTMITREWVIKWSGGGVCPYVLLQVEEGPPPQAHLEGLNANTGSLGAIDTIKARILPSPIFFRYMHSKHLPNAGFRRQRGISNKSNSAVLEVGEQDERRRCTRP